MFRTEISIFSLNIISYGALGSFLSFLNALHVKLLSTWGCEVFILMYF